MNRSGAFFIQFARFGRGSATAAERQHSDSAAKGALWGNQNVADAEHVARLSDSHSIDGDDSRNAEACGARAAFDQTREPQPLIEPPRRDFGRGAVALHASFRSRSLAKG